MGLRFRKSVKVAPGVRVNLGKKSGSVSIGTKGARYTVSSTGKKTTTVGVPGTGVSHVSTSRKKKGRGSTVSSGSTVAIWPPRTYKVCGVILLVLAVVSFALGLPTISFGGWIFLLIGVPCVFIGIHFIKLSKKLTEEYTEPEA